MSYSRFAAITADLLARKGEAKPWGEVAKKPLAWEAPPMVQPPPMRQPSPAQASQLPPDSIAEMKKCTVRMSYYDYERLGILAVKQGKSRQRLLQEAVDRLFTGMSQEFASSCRCLGAAGPAERNCCGNSASFAAEL